VMEGIVKDGQVTRGWIGVEPQDLSPELAETFGIKPGKDGVPTEGVVITGVLQRGPAAQAGIQPGDIIVSVATKPVRNVSELLSNVASLKPGSPSKFGLIRKDKMMELDVSPGMRPKTRPQPQQR